MPAPLLPRWCAPGWDGALAAAEDLARADAAGGAVALPAGARVVKDRPMRATWELEVEGPRGPARVHVKARRARGLAERAKRRLRAPRGPSEGAVLRMLGARGVAVATPVAWCGEDGLDLLVTESIADAVPLSHALRASLDRRERAAIAESVGRLLRAAHDAGWRGRDLHRDNVLVGVSGATLLDPGTAVPGSAPSPLRRARALAVAGHGLGPDPRTALTGLRAYAGGDRAQARALLAAAVPLQRAVARAYRRGRSRRATRDGRWFETFTPAGRASRGVRSRARSPEAWTTLCAAWIERDPPNAVPMKAAGNVVRARLPGLEADVVVKRWDATLRDRFRVPRALRAFRRAYALRVRGVECPEPLLAAADASGRGIAVSALAGGPEGPAVDLDRALRPAGGGPSPFAALSPASRRRALEALGRFLRRLHDAEVVHRDLKAPNLVAWPAAGGVRFAVVDLEGARVFPGRVPWRRRARDLGRLAASVDDAPLSGADRLRVLVGYRASFERCPVALGDFASWVDARRRWKRARSGGRR